MNSAIKQTDQETIRSRGTTSGFTHYGLAVKVRRVQEPDRVPNRTTMKKMSRPTSRREYQSQPSCLPPLPLPVRQRVADQVLGLLGHQVRHCLEDCLANPNARSLDGQISTVLHRLSHAIKQGEAGEQIGEILIDAYRQKVPSPPPPLDSVEPSVMGCPSPGPAGLWSVFIPGRGAWNTQVCVRNGRIQVGDWMPREESAEAEASDPALEKQLLRAKALVIQEAYERKHSVKTDDQDDYEHWLQDLNASRKARGQRLRERMARMSKRD